MSEHIERETRFLAETGFLNAIMVSLSNHDHSLTVLILSLSKDEHVADIGTPGGLCAKAECADHLVERLYAPGQ